MLGCDKNRIDSEIIIGNIKEKFEVINEPIKCRYYNNKYLWVY